MEKKYFFKINEKIIIFLKIFLFLQKIFAENKMTKQEKENFILELLKNTDTNDLNYIYRGYFDSNITNYLISLAEKNIIESKIQAKTKKRVFHIMVESVQNITRHQDYSDERFSHTAFFAIQKNGPFFYITTGNVIDTQHIEPLKQKLEQINNLDTNELTKIYLEILNDGKISEKGGAGLGLIEIVRKSGNKLSYDFKNISASKAFIYMHTYINTDEEDISKKESYIYTFDYIKKLHSQIIDENILLIYCNVFEQSSLVKLISILRTQQYSALSFKKKVISSMVEMLQNIFTHGKTQIENELVSPGIFYIARQENIFFINTVNYIINSKVEQLTNRINYLNSLNEEQLEELYKNQLFDFSKEKNNAGLGFIELLLKSKNAIDYKIYTHDEKYSILKLTVTLKDSENGR